MSGSKFVFCEGGDDVAVIRGVAESISLPDVRVEPFQGKNQLGKFLASVLTRPEFAQNKVESIAIVRDADENEQAAFRSVCDSLSANKLASPASNGGVVSLGMKVGVLVIGPNAGHGMIEDLCLLSVANRPEFRCVEEYFSCIRANRPKSDAKNFSSKAKVRVWMASQADHEFHVGKAAEHGYWPWESPAFDRLKEFLKSL